MRMKKEMSKLSNQTLIAALFEEIVAEEKIEFVDPYDSIWLKLVTIIVYFIEIVSSVVCICFVVFETKGYAGHYRTLINQLLSYLYGAVSFFAPITIYWTSRLLVEAKYNFCSLDNYFSSAHVDIFPYHEWWQATSD